MASLSDGCCDASTALFLCPFSCESDALNPRGSNRRHAQARLGTVRPARQVGPSSFSWKVGGSVLSLSLSPTPGALLLEHQAFYA